MQVELEVTVKCNMCPFEVKRRERDLDNPEVISTDHLVNVHKLGTNHGSFSLEANEVVSMELELESNDPYIELVEDDSDN